MMVYIDTTTPGQSELGSNIYQGVLYTSKSLGTGATPPDAV